MITLLVQIFRAKKNRLKNRQFFISLTGIDPGTVTIPQYRFNKTKQHTPVTLAHSHTPTYTIRTLCVCPVTTTALQKLRYTKDPYVVFCFNVCQEHTVLERCHGDTRWAHGCGAQRTQV